jgi:alpha-tubulin suppressor-like RCC1 family protein
MAPHGCGAALLDLPLEVLTNVCRHLDLCDLLRVSQVCKRFRHGGLETVELPTESPVIADLREVAFPRLELLPRTRPVGCSESWVACLVRCVRQRCCREAPPVAAGLSRSLFVDAAGRLLACGRGATVSHSPVAAMAGIRVQSVAAARGHCLALGWDGRVYSWGNNVAGQLGNGDGLTKPAPVLVEGLEGVRGGAAAFCHSFAVTHSGVVFSWGMALLPEAEDELRPIIVEGFGAVRVRRVSANAGIAFAIGEAGELLSWGDGEHPHLGHGDRQNQPSPKRVEALRSVRVSGASVGHWHALALAEDGLVYAWGENRERTVLGNPHVERELLPKPVEALRGVRMGSVAAAGEHSYAVTDTGELWAWGAKSNGVCPLGHGENNTCPLPKPIESLRGIKVDAVAVGYFHTLALADDGGVYAWGDNDAAKSGALGRGPSVRAAGAAVPTPQRITALRVACCGL